MRGTVETKPQSGRPTAISATTARKIVWDAKKNPRISKCTIRRHLKKDGLHGRVARRKPLLRKCHKVSRLQYANQHRDKPQTFCTKSFGVKRPKLSFLATTINTTFGEESTRPMMKGMEVDR